MGEIGVAPQEKPHLMLSRIDDLPSVQRLEQRTFTSMPALSHLPSLGCLGRVEVDIESSELGGRGPVRVRSLWTY